MLGEIGKLIGEYTALIIFILIICWQQFKEWQWKRKLKRYQKVAEKTIQFLEDIDLKKASDTVIKFIEQIQNSGVLD